jgi:hypothetical protein
MASPVGKRTLPKKFETGVTMLEYVVVPLDQKERDLGAQTDDIQF